MEYKVVYASSLSLIFIFTLFVYLCNFKLAKLRFKSSLSYGYILTLISVLSDIFWVMIDGKPEYIALNYVLNIVEYITFGLISYCWFCYCCTYFLEEFWMKKITKVIAFVPVLIVSLLIITTPLTGWLFTIDNGGYYQRGTFFFLQQTGYLYMFFCSTVSLIEYHRTTLYKQKERFRVIAMFTLPGIVLGSIQLMLPAGAISTLQFSVSLALLMVFINEQQQRITVDGLTKLVNRYEFERILTDKMSHYKKSDAKDIYVIMGDIDNFKSINDVNGHLMGDEALRAVANVLDSLSEKYRAISAHISGDEFCITLDGDSFEVPNNFISDVTKGIKQESKNLGFQVTISLGVAKYESGMSIVDLVSEADEKMYIVKKSKSS